MIHHSCDRCKRVIHTEEELRYSVHIEVKAVFGVEESRHDDDSDHLLELHEILERLEDATDETVGEELYRRRRYDLCPDCYRRYIRNPVGRNVGLSIGFSSN